MYSTCNFLSETKKKLKIVLLFLNNAFVQYNDVQTLIVIRIIVLKIAVRPNHTMKKI